jgi:hypothetical protein
MISEPGAALATALSAVVLAVLGGIVLVNGVTAL